MGFSLRQVRERKLAQWAIAYAAGAWVLIQVLDLLAENFGWPDVVVRSAIVLLAVGLVAVLVLAYYHGEHGRQRVSGAELLMLTALFVIAGVSVALVSRGELGADPDRSVATVPFSGSPLRLTFGLPEDQFLPVGFSQSVLELSPSGSHVVYVGQRAGENRLYLRALDAFELHALPGTEGAREPFFSPDGRWVAFFAEDRLRKIEIDGDIPIDIAETSGRPYGGSWGSDGTILYSLGTSSLWRVPAAGGRPVELPLYTLDGGVRRRVPEPVKWPRFLPGSRHALAAVGWWDERGRPNQTGMTGVVDLASGEFRALFSGSRPHYLASGYIVFDAGLERINAVPFSVERRRVTGPVTSVVTNALRSPGAGANFSVSNGGMLAYPTGGFDRTLVIVDRHGRETPVGVAPRGYRLPDVSPDGRLAAVTIDPQPPHIWVIDLQTGHATPITSDGYNLFADWAPDGRSLLFTRLDVPSPGGYLIRWPDADSLMHIPQTTPHMAPRWARPGQLFVKPVDRQDIRLLDLRTGTTTDLVVTSANEGRPTLSPDGNWVAYTSDATGVEEVYVVPYAGRAAPRPVSRGGSGEPRWSRDGTQLFFRRDDTIWSVPVRTNPTFDLTGPAEPLFSAPYDFSGPFNWDVLPDGRFLMVKSSPDQGREIRIVVNWLAEGPGRSADGSGR